MAASGEAEDFWREHFKDERKVSAAELEEALVPLCDNSAWKLGQAEVAAIRGNLRTIVKSVIRSKSHKGIRLSEFNNFVSRFGPLTDSIKKASEGLFEGGVLVPWFHGDMERTDAEPLLEAPGSFMLRYSKKLPTKLLLSCNADNTIKHEIITNLAEGYWVNDELFEKPLLAAIQSMEHLTQPVRVKKSSKRTSKGDKGKESYKPIIADAESALSVPEVTQSLYSTIMEDAPTLREDNEKERSRSKKKKNKDKDKKKHKDKDKSKKKSKDKEPVHEPSMYTVVDEGGQGLYLSNFET